MKKYCTIIALKVALGIILSACVSQDMIGTSALLENQKLPFDVRLHFPKQSQPYPVMIDLHGCNGIWQQRDQHWLPFFLERGFAVLQIDSFTRRGYSNVCGDVFRVAPMTRTLDVAGAIRLVLKDARFDPNNIFMMGSSHGGTTVLLTNLHSSSVFSRVKGAIAYYPYCLDVLPVLNTNLLIFIGERDDWTPANRCSNMKVINSSQHQLDLIVYPDAYHTFDIPGIDERYFGHRVLYDATATADSRKKIEAFLREHQAQ